MPPAVAKLQKIVSRCLEEESARRWQSGVELERELAAITTTGTRWKLVTAAALGLLVLFAAGYAYLYRSPKLSLHDTVVVGEFENKTGDAVFEQTLRRGLAVQLEQSPFFRLVSDDSIKQALRLMAYSGDRS